MNQNNYETKKKIKKRKQKQKQLEKCEKNSKVYKRKDCQIK